MGEAMPRAGVGMVAAGSPPRIVMIPSVAGGIGHISRTAALARALRRLDPGVEVEFLLDTERLRPFNIDATRRMGFTPRFLPPRTRDNRDAIARACLDRADVVVDDCARYLLPLRRAVPHLGWVTLAMYPVGDELFMDWPLMVQMDAVIWPYAPLVGLPADDPLLVHAPRGFPFGREFGHRVLAGVLGAAAALRAAGHPRLRLVLLAVSDPAELRGVPGVPDPLPDWVGVKGVVTPAESLLHIRAASAVVGEGTSTMHEGAALRTPLVLVPGPIPEAALLAQALDREGAAQVLTLQGTTPDALARVFRAALDGVPGQGEMLDRARALVTGGGGAAAAARVVLDVAARRRASAGEPAARLAAMAGR